VNEDCANYLALQYGPGVAERSRAIASSPKPVRFAQKISEPPTERICPQCGKVFLLDRTKTQKYCSKYCSKKAIARRQRDLMQRKKMEAKR
jgi:endogenous inhibitor of DNA gyrase (YacG/DUF329 family)